MIRVLFFASYREALKTRSMELQLPLPSSTVATVLESLIAEGGELWRQVLDNPNRVVAVNQAVCEMEQPVKDGDEVAFYPPVTGG